MNGKWESGGKEADPFSLLPPSLEAQFLHKVSQETCCVWRVANSGQRGNRSPGMLSLLSLLHLLFPYSCCLGIAFPDKTM